MKNIHIIPTDKPSRLFKANQKLVFDNTNDPIKCISAQHIYITSDEEIKEGVDQWYLDKVLNEPYNSGGAQYSSKQDVIIMTTDQDLIKDGVQPIDDEFLEWFVKNPSCEEVEVKLIKDSEDHPELEGGYREEWEYYDIIIPKEPKQETIEEAAESYAKSKTSHKTFQETHKRDFKEGAKWQQQNSYSEEDLRNAFRQGQENMDFSERYGWSLHLTEKEWFEQFKKK